MTQEQNPKIGDIKEIGDKIQIYMPISGPDAVLDRGLDRENIGYWGPLISDQRGIQSVSILPPLTSEVTWGC